MNKLLHKVIFNSNIGLMIVVCETARNNGKSSNDRVCKIIFFAIVDVRETVSDAYFTQHGFTKLDGKCGAQCFDGVYIKHGEIYIVEVKPLSAKGTIQLSPNKGSKNDIGVQMTDKWITSRVGELDKIGKTETVNAIKNSKTVNKIVVGVNDKTKLSDNVKINHQATHYTEIKVPKGTKLYVGEVGSQGGAWVGGNSQILFKGDSTLKLWNKDTNKPTFEILDKGNFRVPQNWKSGGGELK